MLFLNLANLDGESNHKVRRAPFITSEITSEESLSEWRGIVKTGFPSIAIYQFHGQVTNGDISEAKPFNEANVLLRGSTLTNTGKIIIIFLN